MGPPARPYNFDYTCFLNTRAIKEPQWNMCVPEQATYKIQDDCRAGGKGSGVFCGFEGWVYKATNCS